MEKSALLCKNQDSGAPGPGHSNLYTCAWVPRAGIRTDYVVVSPHYLREAGRACLAIFNRTLSLKGSGYPVL